MRPLTHAVPGALAMLLRDAALSPGKVTFAWRAAVGPALERMTSARLEGRTLIVDATTAQWAREVSRSVNVILPRLQTLLGTDAVTSISVRTASPNVERRTQNAERET
jgi:predicted nucleic acid-binding Zn ribbon protein